jgi:MoaA/NifB/PqqE/SkfB family radical SAM enzyme
MGHKSPLVNTMLVNYDCNLRCKHCSVQENIERLPGPRSFTYDGAVREMERKYQEGARIAFFEGGEPTLWKDGDKDLGDLIEAARSIGYFVTGYTTNGTNVIFEQSDVISVSLDGPREVHDRIRGKGVFDRLMANLAITDHPNIFANMVVMQENKDALKATLEVVKASDRINGLMLNFLTPPPESQALSLEEKRKVVEEAVQLKAQGYPLLNTKRALKELLIEDYEARCPDWASAFVLPGPTYFYGCPMRGTEACKRCGFDAVREYSLIVRGNPMAIAQMSSRFALSRKKNR